WPWSGSCKCRKKVASEGFEERSDPSASRWSGRLREPATKNFANFWFGQDRQRPDSKRQAENPGRRPGDDRQDSSRERERVRTHTYHRERSDKEVAGCGGNRKHRQRRQRYLRSVDPRNRL